MGKTEKIQKENHATKVTKIPKTKRRKYGMNETIQNDTILLKSIHYKRREFLIFTRPKSNTFVEIIQNIIGTAGI